MNSRSSFVLQKQNRKNCTLIHNGIFPTSEQFLTLPTCYYTWSHIATNNPRTSSDLPCHRTYSQMMWAGQWALWAAHDYGSSKVPLPPFTRLLRSIKLSLCHYWRLHQQELYRAIRYFTLVCSELLNATSISRQVVNPPESILAVSVHERSSQLCFCGTKD